MPGARSVPRTFLSSESATRGSSWPGPHVGTRTSPAGNLNSALPNRAMALSVHGLNLGTNNSL